MIQTEYYPRAVWIREYLYDIGCWASGGPKYNYGVQRYFHDHDSLYIVRNAIAPNHPLPAWITIA